MNAQASLRVVGVLLAAGLLPIAGSVTALAFEPGQNLAPVAGASPQNSLPMFLDAARLLDLQSAWRAHFEVEGVTIDEARQTLSRSEKVIREAVEVRERAEELSRRFAIEEAVDGVAVVVTEPRPEPVAEVTPVVAEAATPDAPSETGSVAALSAEPAGMQTEEVPQIHIQKAALTSPKPAAVDVAPPSMLGGPQVEGGSAAEQAPVIEEMGTKPRSQMKPVTAKQAARRVTVQAEPQPTGLFGIFSSLGAPAETVSASEPLSADADKNTQMPTELRAFGWSSQP